MSTKILPILAIATAFSVSGCAYWNEEAGASLDQGDFGNATMNNQLAQTCRKLTPSNIGKYGQPIASNCPGRLQDGKYALFAYRETITSARERISDSVAGAEVEAQ